MTTSQNITRMTSKDFLWHRLHSLSGIWLVVYLCVHLFTNSQAALTPDGFIRSVNSIHEIPFLPAVEVAVLAIPILIHLIWGIKYSKAKFNSFGNTGKAPYLPQYPVNHAFTWQRITAWFLILGIFAHVVHMRFLQYPLSTQTDNKPLYAVQVTPDEKLNDLASKHGIEILTPVEAKKIFKEKLSGTGQPIAVADNFGSVELFMLRETFKSPFMLAFYTLLVLTACFHAFNGLWTAMITWGITLSIRSQQMMRYFSNALMCIVAILGLCAIWFTV